MGSVLIDPPAISQVAGLLRPQDFAREKHGAIWKAMLMAYHNRLDPDQVIVGRQLRIQGDFESTGGMGYLSHLVSITPTSVSLPYYVQVVREAARQREIIRVAGNIAALAYEQQPSEETIHDGVVALMRVARQDSLNRPLSALEMYEAHSATLLDELDHAPDEMPGVTTGFLDLDRMLGGWQKGLFYIIGARTSIGKTTFAAASGLKLALSGQHVMYLTLETTWRQMMARMVYSMAQVNSSAYRRLPKDSPARESQREAVIEAVNRFDQLPVTILDQRGITPTAIRGVMQSYVQSHGKPSLVMLDYLNLVGSDGYHRSRYERISDIVIQLKDVGGELDVPMVVMAQLSRQPESRVDDAKRPSLSDFRDSGTIEEVASCVLGLYRESYYYPSSTERSEWELRHGRPFPEKELEVHVLKQQMGPTGFVSIYCDMETGHLDNLARNGNRD